MDEDFRKRLDDTLTVMSAFQRQHDQAIRDHQEWLVVHDQAFVRHARAVAEADEQIKILFHLQTLTEQKLLEVGEKLDEVGEKLDALIHIVDGHVHSPHPNGGSNPIAPEPES